jgi:hypothetical protein
MDPVGGAGLRTRGRAALGFVLAAGVGAMPEAHACTTASCPLVTQSQDALRAKGVFAVDVSFRYMSDSRLQRGRGADEAALAPYVSFEAGTVYPGHHRDQSMEHRLLQVDLSYGLTSRLSLFGSLPLVNDREHSQFELVAPGAVFEGHASHGPVPAGAVVSPFTTRHARSGVGDVQLGAGYAVLGSAREALAARALVELPTGAYRLRDAQGFIDRPELQPGSGSTDLLLGLHYQRSVSSSGAALFGAASLRRNGTNGLGYRFGRELSIGTGITQGPARRGRLSLQLTLRHTERDRFQAGGVPSTGATTLSLAPGVRLRTPGRSVLYAYAKLPVAQRVNEAQLTPRVDVVVGLSRSF